jgi:hypothetical protein
MVMVQGIAALANYESMPPLPMKLLTFLLALLFAAMLRFRKRLD